jgi:TldD protein
MREAVISVFLVVFSVPAIAKDKPSAKSAAQLTAQPVQAAPSPLLATVQQELDREMSILSNAEPAAYFMGYTITDSNRAEVTGSNGALLSSRQDHSRWLEAQVRVGSYQLDNTHRVGNGGAEPPGSFGELIPIEDDPGVLRRAMWRETDSQYRAAAEALIKIKTGKDVQVQDAAQEMVRRAFGSPLVWPDMVDPILQADIPNAQKEAVLGGNLAKLLT